MKRTVVRGGWVVCHPGDGHALMRDGVVVVDDGAISAVTAEYDGQADVVIDAAGKLVCPGFVDTHVHVGTRATHRLIADSGNPYFFGQPFLHWAVTRRGVPSPGGDGVRLGGEADRFASLFTIAELLRNGITTFVEVGGRAPMLGACAEVAAELGIRAYLGPGIASSYYVDGRPDRMWDRAVDPVREREQMQAARDFAERYDGSADGRVHAVLAPRELENCSLPLLEEIRALAEERNLPVEVHAAYSPIEWQCITQEHGCTPVEYLERAGLLGPSVILGHGNLIAELNPSWPGGRDLEILSATGTSVSHSPVNLTRRGRTFDSLARYLGAGVNVALGTDTYPRDMIEQMRMASYLCKVMAADYTVGTAADVFNAATLGGATALRRPDLGRIAPGAAADLVVVSLRPQGSMRYGVIHDPVKALVDCGVGDDVELVMVDGRVVVEGGRLCDVDTAELLESAQCDAHRYWAGVQDWDPARRAMENWSPWAFPLVS